MSKSHAALSIRSVNNYMRLVLQLVRSVKDPETGEPVHRLKLNREYLGLPKIVKDEQHVPAVTAGQVEKLVSESKGDEQALYVIAAATGTRIAEILGLEARHIINNGRTLVVEQSVNRFGRLSGLKTRAAKRNVDASKAFGDYLLSLIEGKSGLLFNTKRGTPLRARNLRRRWLDKRLDDYGFHSFRRFRITHLEAVRAHGHLTKIWAGHSLGNDITSEYAKSLKENLSLRQPFFEFVSQRHNALSNLIVFQVCSNFGLGPSPVLSYFVRKRNPTIVSSSLCGGDDDVLFRIKPRDIKTQHSSIQAVMYSFVSRKVQSVEFVSTSACP